MTIHAIQNSYKTRSREHSRTLSSGIRACRRQCAVRPIPASGPSHGIWRQPPVAGRDEPVGEQLPCGKAVKRFGVGTQLDKPVV